MKVLAGIAFALLLVAVGVFMAVRKLQERAEATGEERGDAERANARAGFWKRMAQADKVDSMETARERARARRERRRLREESEGDRGGPDLPGAA